MDWHNNFLRELTTDVTIDSHLDRRLELLLIDYLVSLKAGKSLGRINHLGASLAMSSSATDSDDFDWTFMTHPGSVIWSAIFHQLFMNPESIHDIKLAAYYGYRVNASISGAFGVSHRQKWHATAISGAFASAAASNVMIKATPDQFFSSLLHVAANMGVSHLPTAELARRFLIVALLPLLEFWRAKLHWQTSHVQQVFGKASKD